MSTLLGTDAPAVKSKSKWKRNIGLHGRSSKSRHSHSSGRSTTTGDTPQELSYEESANKNNFKTIYLRVYCEKVREGDHFKTIQVLRNFTVERCITDIVRCYYTKLGSPTDFELMEVIGKITKIPNIDARAEPTLLFSEMKSRTLSSKETLQSIFFATTPGPGLARRIELRKIEADIRRSKTLIAPSPLTSAETAQTPTLIRVNTAARTNSPVRIRDSRSCRSLDTVQNPPGPHLTLVRGKQPNKDVLFHDLSNIINFENNSRREVTIGTRCDASIYLYDAPHAKGSSRQQYIFALFVGYNYPITLSGGSMASGAIYLEPAYVDSSVSLYAFPTIYVNNELIATADRPTFEKRRLIPGDVLIFGTKEDGYTYMFKDPRWGPEFNNQKEFTKVTGSADINPLRLSTEKKTRSISVSSHSSENCSCSTNSLHHRKHVQRVSEVEMRTAISILPRVQHLRLVVTSLFPQHRQIARNGSVYPLELLPSGWTRMEPWRSAGMFAQLIRSAGQLINDNNPPIPNSDISRRNSSEIHEYTRNLVKNLCSLLKECYDGMLKSADNLVVAALWLCLFCYDLAIFLTPGWLFDGANNLKMLPDRPGSSLSQGRINIIRGVHEDERCSSRSTSPRTSVISEPNGLTVETLPEVAELARTAYELAETALRTGVVKTVYEMIAPYLDTFCDQADPFEEPYSELGDLFTSLKTCFHVAFYPNGIDAQLAKHLASDSFSSISSSSSTGSGSRMVQKGGRNSSTSQLSSDRLTSMSCLHATAHKKSWPESNGSHVGVATNSTASTTNRVESVVWRQLMATITHHTLHYIITCVDLPLDMTTGTFLVNGINWLTEWLRESNLQSNRRPLNLLSAFSSLLATPKEKLYDMSWRVMRGMYPDLPPALLRLITEQYEHEEGGKPELNWDIDPQDTNAANEDPLELIDMQLNGWQSKESLNVLKGNIKCKLTYRPWDLHTLFRQNGTEDMIQMLDSELQAHQVEFQWSELQRNFRPPKAVVPINNNLTRNEPFNKLLRPNTRQRQAYGRRIKPLTPLIVTPTASVQNNRHSPGRYTRGSRDETLQYRPSSTISMTSTSMQNLAGMLNPMRPAQSNMEPVQIIRKFDSNGNPIRSETSFLTEHNQSTISVSQPNQSAIHQLRTLAKSLQEIDFNTLMKEEEQQNKPYSYSTTRDKVPSKVVEAYSAGGQDFTPGMYTSYPNLTFSQKLGEYRNEEFGCSDHARRKTTGVTLPGSLLTAKGRGSAHSSSMWQLSGTTEYEREPSINKQMDPRQLLTASHEWRDFRKSLLGRGLDKSRTPIPFSRKGISYNPLSHSIPNLSSYKQRFGNPDGSDSYEEYNDQLDPSDSFTDVLSHNEHDNAIFNVTLSRLPTGYGLLLIDGEQTAHDQPGVFVKTITVNSVADESGQFQIGDQILAINGKDLTTMTFTDAVALLKSCKVSATFTIRRSSILDPTLLTKKTEQ